MRLSCQTTLYRCVVAFSILSIVAGEARAQTGTSRWSAIGTFDAGTAAAALVNPNSCGYDKPEGDVVAGGGIGAIYRPRAGLIVMGDVRAASTPIVTGCKLVLPVPIQIGLNEWESWATRSYPHGAAEAPLVRTAIHIGKEMSPGFLLWRAMVGGGVIWSGDPTPYVSVAIGGGSERRGTRFFLELGMSATRLSVREEHTRLREVDGTQTPLSPRVESFTLYPRWTMFRLGVEVPLVSGR